MFIVFWLAQVMVLNRIHLFGCATPLLYVYFVVMFPRNYPKWALLLWSFCLGLMVDIFSNTPGVASASLTLIAVIQPYFFELFVPRDSIDTLEPSLNMLGFSKYSVYVATLTLLFCLVFFTLETFNFFNWLLWVECVCGSAVLTVVLILTLEYFRGSKAEPSQA